MYDDTAIIDDININRKIEKIFIQCENKNLNTASALKDNLLSKLNRVGLIAEDVNMNGPILPQLFDADVLVNGFTKINKSIIDASPKLKMVHQSGIGIDNVDVNYCTSKSIYVANVPLANAVSVARKEENILGSELQSKILFIIGLGATGIEVAKRAKSFGMHIIAITNDPFWKRPDIDRTL